MLRDRGRIKWTAMMLPEHVRLLREWQKEDTLTDRPQLDEFDLQLIGEELELAYKRKCDVRIKTWKDGCVTQSEGTITDINPNLKYLEYEHPLGTSKIQFDEIISVASLV